MMNRRTVLKGVSAGAGAFLFAPLMQKVALHAQGVPARPKRVIFFLFDNGFKDNGAVPIGTNLASNEKRQFSLRGHRLPLDIEPFAPFQDRMTLLHGMRSHTAVDHGGFFAALSGMAGNKHLPLAESIDAAIARVVPAVLPLVVLGVGGGTTAYCCSALGPARPIAAICRPEMAYESLFGRIGATRNDFASRKNLLDFVTEDVRQLRSEVAGPERELVDHHLEAIESLSGRAEQLSRMHESGELRRHAPRLPATPPSRMTDVVAAQCDIAAAALVSGLTNVVTITSGLCSIPANYSGISNAHPHGLGHGTGDPELNLRSGFEVLSRYHNYLAQQAARLLTKLQETREGTGTMLDNTVLVFMSDSANQQHSWRGANWPFVLVGNLGGALRSGQFLSYPVSMRQTWDAAGLEMGAAGDNNPVLNALYCTLLHAVGRPRDTFNRSSSATDAPALYGPLADLLA